MVHLTLHARTELTENQENGDLRVVVDVGFEDVLDVGRVGDVSVGGEGHGDDDGSCRR